MSSEILDEQVNDNFDTTSTCCGDNLPSNGSADLEHLRGCMLHKLAIQCGKILAGSWLDCNNVHVKKLETCGLSNYLYVACLKDHVCKKSDEPFKVLVRVYGEGLRSSCHSLVSDAISFTILSEKGIGPRLHGIFSGGRIEEFIDSRTLTCAELSLPKVSRIVASHMARIHKLNMPFSKEPTSLFKMMVNFLSKITSGEDTSGLHREVNSSSASLTALEREIDARNGPVNSTVANAASLLGRLNIQEEYAWLKTLLLGEPGSSFPVVFCHNDMQENNILVLDDSIKGTSYNLLMIDFEYSRYNFRAFDVGNHFNEWCFDYSVDHAPYFIYNFNRYPTSSEQATFWSSYLSAFRGGADESGSTSSFSSSSSPPLILPPAGLTVDAISFSETEFYRLWVEATLGALYSNVFWSVWSLHQSIMSKIKFDFCAYAIARMDTYRRLKEEFLSRYQNGIAAEFTNEETIVSAHQNGE